LAALALCLSGAVVAGVVATAAPAGAANPSPLLYEIDYNGNAINSFPTTATGSVTPTVSNDNSALNSPSGAAFDAAGDLWVANYNGTNPSLAEFTPSQLASTTSPAPAVVITSSAWTSDEGPNAIAFDAAGDLWATSFTGSVVEFKANQLTSTGSETPAVTLTGATATWGLSFDAAGDLWVGDYGDGDVLGYTPSQLTTSGSSASAIVLSGFNSPKFPTFDAKGDLWVAQATTGTVNEFTPGQLTSSGTPTAAVTLSSSNFGSPFGLAFDTSGDLWVADYGSNELYKFTPSQLTSSGAPTPAASLQGTTNFSGPTDVVIKEPPVVTSLSTSSGAAGTTVTITGAGFDYGSTVDFGTAAAAVTYVSPYELEAVAPAGTGTVDVTVSTFAGTSTSTDPFSYPATPAPPVTSPTQTPSHGYWLVGSDGGIFSFGSAQFYGSTGSLALQRPVVGIVPTKDHGGYWLDASDGGVFSFGDTQFYGSIPGLGLHPAGSGLPNSLNAPIVGMVPSIDDGGYFMVASDGGVFAFGDAHFAGSCPGIGGCAGAAVAVMPDASGKGYWLVTQTGNVYTFGDAHYDGAPGNTGSPVTSAVRTPDGGGYWILTANGHVYNYGDAANYGSPSSGSFSVLNPATAVFTTSDGAGYWVSSAAGQIFNFGDAPNDGDTSATHLNGAIIAGTGF
jgi:sugar lactone lactonase YvrE